MSNLASSTPSAVLDLSYIMTTNFSKVFRSSSSTTGGYWLSLLKTLEASSQTSQVCQADFFPLPRNAESDIAASEGMEEEHPFALFCKSATQVMYRNPPQVLSLAKGNPQLLQT
ncbi:hypothetical protein AAFF_G00276940 [Aldrovandia affinis]|uniref:Uncharacterized protein n=1 Tax=Aldrovandia affinis TaxID=143900 RepID=A0AAD7W2H6_9TELE|nr:hypothetical protein AAFF_G00276940 [Aldrovandia affinis]